MNKSMGAASLLLGALLLSACDTVPKCSGVEPDGEVEKFTSCPAGWAPGEQRSIQEDEFKDLEEVDLRKMKPKPTTITTVAPYTPPAAPRTAVKPTPVQTPQKLPMQGYKPPAPVKK